MPGAAGAVHAQGRHCATGAVPCANRRCDPYKRHRLSRRCPLPPPGKHAVVIGRSNLVGKPIALLLQRWALACLRAVCSLARCRRSRNATVTMCHSKTTDLASVVKQADIVVCAIGKPNYVQGCAGQRRRVRALKWRSRSSWVKPGAVVVDVGINAVDDATKKSGCAAESIAAHPAESWLPV